MADNKAWQVIQTAPFIGGLNTEVNDLQDATQYTSDELNMVIKNNGTRARRLGVDYEEGYKLSINTITSPKEKAAFNACEWTVTKPGREASYIVVQNGNRLFFYKNSGAPFSAEQVTEVDTTDILTINLEDFSLHNAYSVDKEPVSFATAYGGLFVCSKAIKPFFLDDVLMDPSVEPEHLNATATLNITTAYNNKSPREYESEKRFFVNGVELFTSQLLGETTYHYYDGRNVTVAHQPQFQGTSPTPMMDDFGNLVTTGIAQIETYANPVPNSGANVPATVKYIYMRTAHYYADLWNAQDAAARHNLTATAVTPYGVGRIAPENYYPTDAEIAQYGADAREFITFTAPEGDAYSDIEIKVETRARSNKLYKHYPIAYTRTVRTSQYLSNAISKEFDVRIRDFEGVEETFNNIVDLRYGSGVSYRPSLPSDPATMTDEEKDFYHRHQYNLYNQGWNDPTTYNNTSMTALNAYLSDPSNADPNVVGNVFYPALSYQWFLSKDPTTLAFKPAELINVAFGQTRAPTGRYVLSYLNQDRSEASGIAGIPVVVPKTPYFVDIIAYAGRVWYLSGDTVLYSQVLLDDLSKADKCYQEADPTSETISDLLDTDGGMIQIPELGEGVKFCLVGAALAVVGTKSIQLISGGQNNAFTATAYVRGAMQAYTTISPQSFVTTEYGTFFWSDVGVVLLSYQEGFAAQNITESTINTFYQKIPDWAMKECVGVYNRAQKQIVWMYPSKEKYPKSLNRILIYDILKGSWTPFEIAAEYGEDENPLPWIVGGLTLNTPFKADNIYPVYVEGAEVVDNEGYRILADDPIEKEEQTFKSALFLCVDYNNDSKMTFGYFDNLNCLDWAAGDIYGPGVNYNSYLVSHPINLNSTAYNKTIPYLLTYFRRTETGYTLDGAKIYPSACQGAIQWDWNNSGKAGKWDAQQELYRYDKYFDSYSVVDDDGNTVMTLAEDFDEVVDGAFTDAVNIVDPIEKGTLLENDYVFSKTRIYGGGRAFKVKLSSVDNNYFIIENVGFNIYGDARI